MLVVVWQEHEAPSNLGSSEEVDNCAERVLSGSVSIAADTSLRHRASAPDRNWLLSVPGI